MNRFFALLEVILLIGSSRVSQKADKLDFYNTLCTPVVFVKRVLH